MGNPHFGLGGLTWSPFHNVQAGAASSDTQAQTASKPLGWEDEDGYTP